MSISKILMKLSKNLLCLNLLIASCFIFSACSLNSPTNENLPFAAAHTAIAQRQAEQKYLDTGTIILSQKVPVQPYIAELAHTPLSNGNSARFAPLVGYFPPTSSFLPADNELWIEIESSTNKLVLHRGKDSLKTIYGEGSVVLEPGQYHIQHKQTEPLWYAPDDYFAKRQLPVPPAGDRLRYRRGALGPMVLYPTTSFPIHSAPVWSEDVGGLRLSQADLSAIYEMLSIGTPILVK